MHNAGFLLGKTVRKVMGGDSQATRIFGGFNFPCRISFFGIIHLIPKWRIVVTCPSMPRFRADHPERPPFGIRCIYLIHLITLSVSESRIDVIICFRLPYCNFLVAKWINKINSKMAVARDDLGRAARKRGIEGQVTIIRHFEIRRISCTNLFFSWEKFGRSMYRIFSGLPAMHGCFLLLLLFRRPPPPPPQLF